MHPWCKYRLQDRYLADKHRRNLQVHPDGSDEPMPPVVHSPWHWQAWTSELWIYVLPLLAWDIISPRRHRRLAAFTAPTTVQMLTHVAGGLILYDALFFFGHLLLHKVPLLYKLVHKKHHKIEEVRACEMARLSFGEEVLDVGFSIIALNWMGAHPLARSLYNIIIVFLLCELHSGFDFPWTPQNVMPFGIATGSRRHQYHHRFGRHYYQKFFFTLDRIFGFFQEQDGSLKGDSVKKVPYIPSSWKSA
jgi:sterol desaturase/sphingolipid hydroxylase (fatty acid hydroxylase superfamily)